MIYTKTRLAASKLSAANSICRTLRHRIRTRACCFGSDRSLPMNAPVKISRVLFPPTPAEPIVEHALHYARAGWSVFPLRLGEKISHKSAAHSDGRKWGQTTDVNEIRRDFKTVAKCKCRHCNRCGVRLLRRRDRHGRWSWPKASMAQPHWRSIGSRTWLRCRPHWRPRVLAGRSTGTTSTPASRSRTRHQRSHRAVDVRGDGGMVVAPPSVKPGKGAYKWRNRPSHRRCAAVVAR